MDTTTMTPAQEVAAGLRARAHAAQLRSRLLADMAEAEARQGEALARYADTLDPWTCSGWDSCPNPEHQHNRGEGDTYGTD